MPVIITHFLCLITFMDYDESGLMHLPEKKSSTEVNSAARAALVTRAAV